MESISDESSFSRNSREQDEGRYHGGNLVLWVAAIAVLIGLNFASWSFCMWVFGQPEHPMNYRLLTRLEKLDPIHGFTPVSAPRGKFYSAKDLYAEVYPLSARELDAYNRIRKRFFLQNYRQGSDVVFLSGEFRVESTKYLDEEDIFPGGVAIRAVSTSFPDLSVDLVLPSKSPPETFELQRGSIIEVEESLFCASVLNVHRVDEAAMVVTAVPLVTRVSPRNPGDPFLPRPFQFAENAAIELTTPPTIQLEPERWPVTYGKMEIEPKPVELKAEESEGSEEVAESPGESAAG